MAILNEGIRKAAMWAPIQFKRDRPNEDLRLPSIIIFKDNVWSPVNKIDNLNRDFFCPMPRLNFEFEFDTHLQVALVI